MPCPSPAARPATGAPRARGLARHAGALTAAALLCAVAAPTASADSAAPSPSASAALPAGLFGTADPTYDGVWRQSTALLALSAVKAPVPGPAVSWLVGQQCADGGFGAFRARTSTACAAKSEDTNSTGLAVQALARLGGHQAVVDRAVGWLKAAQNDDGGWGYQRGAASDTDSTAVVVGALSASGTDPREVTRGGHTPLDALLSWQTGCDAKAQARGAFAYQQDPKSGKLTANDKATTDGIIGAHDSGYVVTAPAADRTPKALACPTGGTGRASDAAASAQAASAYLAGVLDAGGDHLTTAQPGSDKKSPDYGSTADAVLALAADGHRAAARKPYEWLVKNGTGWAEHDPAGLGSLILAAAAVGENPHDFGGADLVRQLQNTGPQTATPASTPPSAGQRDQAGGSLNKWWVIGIGLLAGAGIGWAISFRKKKRP